MVSSAYISMVELFKCKGITFTSKRNKTGPRIGFGSDVVCPSFTN